jgi:hypothetical protein
VTYTQIQPFYVFICQFLRIIIHFALWSSDNFPEADQVGLRCNLRFFVKSWAGICHSWGVDGKYLRSEKTRRFVSSFAQVQHGRKLLPSTVAQFTSQVVCRLSRDARTAYMPHAIGFLSRSRRSMKNSIRSNFVPRQQNLWVRFGSGSFPSW